MDTSFLVNKKMELLKNSVMIQNIHQQSLIRRMAVKESFSLKMNRVSMNSMACINVRL